MKNILVYLMLCVSFCYGQIFDTTISDKGKPGGFERIREFDSKGNIQKTWITTWNQGLMKKSFLEQDNNAECTAQVESTFNNNGNLQGVQHFLGQNIGQEEIEYTPSGTMIRKSIFLFIDGNYIIYRKDYDGSWHYSALADGNPPKPVAINEEEYINAEQLFRKRSAERSQTLSLSSGLTSQQSGVIAQFNGNDIRNTKPFVVSSPWEVQWDAKGEFFSIYLYSEDGSLINVLGNQNTPGEGSSYFPKSGKYYFSISTLGDWSVKVVRAQ